MREQAAMSVEQIVERVWLSIAERRLRPGVQLKEEQLASIFHVSRARVRQALTVLARDGLVTIIPNRGAFVCKPSVEEARDVFFVRQAVERCVVERLCSSMSKDGVKRLRDHVKNERIANAEDSTTDIIKLSGGFHLLLAELTGSDFLFTTMRDLIARSSLITAVTGTPRASIAVRTSMPTSSRRLRRKKPKEPYISCRIIWNMWSPSST